MLFLNPLIIVITKGERGKESMHVMVLNIKKLEEACRRLHK